MKSKSILSCLLAVLTAGSVAAGTVSVSNTAPAVDGADIANDSGAVDAGGDQGHMWGNRPHQGQTFVTGANAGGYQLTAVTLKNLNNTVSNGPTFNVVVGSVSGTILTQVGSTETAVSPNYSPNNYITFNFDTPLTLAANTTYGFLWGSAASGFVTVNNLDGSTYGDGTAISSGDNNVPNLANLIDRGVDRVFHLDLDLIIADDDDGDGLPNQWEIDNSLNPNSSVGDDGATGDPDTDGSDNANEFLKGTDPQDDDSDDDLLLDGVETGTGSFVDAMNTGTSPILADTDGDGLSDGEEVVPTTYILSGPIDPLQAGTNGSFGTGTGSGSGTISGTYDPVTNLIDYTIKWADLTAGITNMHFHRGAPGVGGGVDLGVPGPWASPQIATGATVSAAAEINLLAGNWYLNIHTSAFSGGEVRGQVLISLVPSTNPTDPDSDDDNLNDAEESSAGADGFITDPNDPDTDGDAVNDDLDLDPLVPDPDPDGDGLSSADEISGALNPFGDPTDPNNADTDGDGIDDGDELDAGTGESIVTNPAAADTDGDGLDDDVEFAGTTDPTLADTDGDGFDDGVEVANGSDPNDPGDLPLLSLILVSNVAPVVDGDDIAQLNEVGHTDPGGNEGHIWSNRPLQGQTFTTGANAGGYVLNAVTLRNEENTINNNTATFQVRIGTVSGTVFTEVAVSTSNNSISYVPNDYMTFQFGTPVTLDPNTVYGFMWGTSGSGFTTWGNVNTEYPEGEAFSSGNGGMPDDNALVLRGIDREFHLDIDGIGGGLQLLDVERFGPNSESIRITWESRIGKKYAIDSGLDLVTWDFEVADEILSGGATTVFEELLANLPQNGPGVYFRVRELVSPPALSADFESGAAGWTSGFDGVDATQWELGAPLNFGPAGANSPVNCWGTNIAAEYADDANCWLRSPTFDLTGAGSAILTWFQWVDIDTFDSGTVKIFDASDDTELGVIEASVGGLADSWTQITKTLPAAALDKMVYLEFRFLSDDDNVVFPGWYIDDVVVTVP